MIKLKNSIMEHLESYPYLYYLKNGKNKSGIPGTDLAEKINRLNVSNYLTPVLFYRDVNRILLSAQDSHLNFYPEIMRTFLFLLPYRFSIIKKRNIYSVIATENKRANVTGYYLNYLNGCDIRNKRIIELNISDQNYIENEPPEVTISRWCLNNVKNTHTKHGKQSHCLNFQFSNRNLLDNEFPDDEISVIYDDKGTNKTCRLPFIGCCMKNISVTQQELNKEEEKTLSKENMELSLSNFKEYNINKKKNEIEMEECNSNKVKKLEGRDESKEKDKDNIDEMIIKNLTFKLLDEENINKTIKYLFYPINKNINSYIMPSIELACLSIISFTKSSGDNFGEIFNKLIKFINAAKNNNCKYLIISLLSNYGGNIDFSELLKVIIWPNLFKKELLYSMPFSFYNTDILDIYLKHSNSSMNIYSDNKDIKERWKNDNGYYDGKEIDDDNYLDRRTWSDFYTIISNNIKNQYNKFSDNGERKDESMFDSNNILILTDSNCASTCAIFMKSVAINKLGRVVRYGKILFDDENMSSDIGYCCAGPEIDLAAILPTFRREEKHIVKIEDDYVDSIHFCYPNGAPVNTHDGMNNSFYDFKDIKPSFEDDMIIDYSNIKSDEYLIPLFTYSCRYFFKSSEVNETVKESCGGSCEDRDKTEGLCGYNDDKKLNNFNKNNDIFGKSEKRGKERNKESIPKKLNHEKKEDL